MDIESALKALPLALRGCSTPEISFDNTGKVIIPRHSSPRVLSLMAVMSEPCVLYKYIDKCLTETTPTTLVLQALFSCIREQLVGYVSLITELQLNSIADVHVKLTTPTLYLRLFASVIDETHLNSDKVTLRMLSDYTMHGDPLVRKYARCLYEAALEPFNRIKQEWEEFGSLGLDLHKEFYVREKENIQLEKKASLPEFEFIAANIPPHITYNEALDSMEQGKALYFVRYVCGHSEFDGKNKTLMEVNQFTYSVLMNECKLMVHFKGLRDYMLLTNGNFVEALFRNDHDGFLGKPVSEVSTYYATNFYLAAVEDISNPPLDDIDVLKSIDAHVLGIGKHHSSSSDIKVWEAFCGQYHRDSRALKVIVDRPMMVKYERCFASLWRLRLALRSTTHSQRILSDLYKSSTSMTVHDREQLLRLNRLHNYLNSHLISINFYVYYIVIEAHWERLQQKLSETMLTLDEITNAHKEYLEEILAAVATPEKAASIQKITLMVLELEAWLQEGKFSNAQRMEEFRQAFADHIKILNFR